MQILTDKTLEKVTAKQQADTLLKKPCYIRLSDIY